MYVKFRGWNGTKKEPHEAALKVKQGEKSDPKPRGKFV
jgi:hypothetical protein